MATEPIFNRWNNVTSDVRNELVFANRNQAYGAYDLRRRYNRTVALAVIVTCVSFSLIVSLPAIIDMIKHKTEEVVVPVDITPTDLIAPPPLDDKEPPPPPPPPPPPAIETVKFTPPVVTDEKVEEDPPPVQTDETPQISTVTKEGTGDDIIIIPDEKGTVVAPAEEQIFTVVEQQAQFPGGDAAMMKWISDRINQKGYPQMEKEAGISGTCYVTFVVERDGSITNIKLLRGVSGGPGYNKLAQDVVKEMPAWKPGKQNGHEVRVQFNLPIKFILK